jgi:hypothetical protein
MTTPPSGPRPVAHERKNPLMKSIGDPQLPARVPETDRLARKTASTITDPQLDALYEQRDALLRLLAVCLIAGAAA